MKKIVSVLLYVSFVFLSVCSGKKEGELKEHTQNELTVVQNEIAYTLNPMKLNSASFLRGIGAAEALFTVSPDGQVHPSIAESAEEIDAVTWDIKLRSNVNFWSGKNVDADSVIASFEDSRKNDPHSLTYLSDLTFSKLDNQTIRVKTKRQYMNVPLNLSYYQTVIHNAEQTFETVVTADLTGMYRIVEFEPKKRLVLELNKNYWGEKPMIERVVNLEIPDEQTRVLMALSGDADIVTDIPDSSIKQVESSTAINLVDSPRGSPNTIYLNLNKPYFHDVRVRQALSWALNRKELVELGAEGHSEVCTTWIGSNPEYSEEKNAVYTNMDLTKASALLDEAGWIVGSDGIREKNGEKLNFKLQTWGNGKALGEALQYQWRQIGANVEAQYVDYTLIEASRQSGEWDAFIEAWGTFGDVYSLLMGHFSPNGGANYAKWNDTEVNNLLEQLSTSTDATERHALAVKINRRTAVEAPIICVYLYPALIAVNKNLSGFVGHFRQFEYIVNADLRFNEQ
jgi:peptide/nickel transport system substrate-binding protein